MITVFILFLNIYSFQILFFDEITTNLLPHSYNGYEFKTINTNYTKYMKTQINILNIHNFNNKFVGDFWATKPNVLTTNGEIIEITRNDKYYFVIRGLYMTSLYIDGLGMTINGYHNNSKVYNKRIYLSGGNLTKIVLNWFNVDRIIIKCMNPYPAVCSVVAYDNIELAAIMC